MITIIAIAWYLIGSVVAGFVYFKIEKELTRGDCIMFLTLGGCMGVLTLLILIASSDWGEKKLF